MCGITGIFHFSQGYDIDVRILEGMTNTLAHRGPDDSGYYHEKNIGLGFKRLSIIDLAHGNQPLFNEDKTVISVCNGEIYNFKELKSMLISKGHRFYTNCDVEVLPHLYEEFGNDFLNRLNGQFSFAIFDKKKNTLLLARDHVGITPLFYTRVGPTLIFASEVKAILKHSLVEKRVDLTGLDQILSFPGIVSPRTMFQNIQSLKPGHSLTANHQGLKLHEYWDLNYPTDQEQVEDWPESYYTEKLDELLTSAVELRLNADVPVGFYLSGGLDSSLIGSLIKKVSPDVRRHSFSIGFKEEDIDERRYQIMMAEYLKTDHHEIVFDWLDISSRFRDAIYHAETPLKETYNTCSLALSESVRQNDLKVILTGEGSDELFAGYVGYRFDRQRAHLAATDFTDLERILEDQEREKLWGDPGFFYETDQYAFKEIRAALYSDSVNEQFDQFDCTEKELVDKGKLAGRDPLHKRSYLDFKLRLSDHLLADHGDRVAYANSVEARYPFLDVRLLEFARTIPPHLKLNHYTEKYILKKVAEPYVPEPIINREKFGFVAPGSPFLLRQNIEWINDILSYQTIRKQGYFNPDTVERLKTKYLTDGFKLNVPFEKDLLIVVITFGLFLDVFGMPNVNG